MNPFELQTQLAQQWFQFARSATTNAMTAYATWNEQATGMLRASFPWAGLAPAPAATNPFFPFSWWQGPMAMTPPAFTAFGGAGWPQNLFAAGNPLTAQNPFAAWMGLMSGQSLPKAPMFPGWPMPFAQSPFQSAFTQPPFLDAMTKFMTPWTFAQAPLQAWASAFTQPARNPGTQLIEQIASNYRTASGYAVAAVVGPLGRALDPRTYGEPWWQAFDKTRKLSKVNG